MKVVGAELKPLWQNIADPDMFHEWKNCDVWNVPYELWSMNWEEWTVKCELRSVSTCTCMNAGWVRTINYKVWSTCVLKCHNHRLPGNQPEAPKGRNAKNTSNACESCDARTMKCKKWSLYCELRSQRPFDLSLKSV